MVDMMSTMKDDGSRLNLQIAERVSELRASAGLSLDGLARKTGVSRSMISLVERAESSPTALVLEKLAAGLGVTLASLFDAPRSKETEASGPVSRFEDQPQWRDPGSGYLRRNVSPAGVPQAIRIVEVNFPARTRVAFETGAREVPVQQQVWVLTGEIDIRVGDEQYTLRKGDCLALQLDRPMVFHNATRKTARYAVVTATGGASRR
jgi:transcriptional regulator with XRE-family HTH domain